MPQTIEAIQHAKAAGVPLIVAVNRSIKRVQTQTTLRMSFSAQYDVIPEEWGGENMGFVHISAKQGTNIDGLQKQSFSLKFLNWSQLKKAWHLVLLLNLVLIKVVVQLQQSLVQSGT